jgi:hypothetical protein
LEEPAILRRSFRRRATWPWICCQSGILAWGIPPVGYRTSSEIIGQKRNGEPRHGHKLVKDEAVADRVALAWRLKLEEDASYEQIHEATRLYSNRQHYSHFFDNLLYAGVFVYHGQRFPSNWEHGERFCEPYVSLDEFSKVQANRQRRVVIRDTKSPRVLASNVLLSGLVVCGRCLAKGKRVTVTARVDKRRENTAWYICGVKLRQRVSDCDLPRVACWLLEETIIESLMSSVLTPEYVMEQLGHAQRLLENQRPGYETQVRSLEHAAREKEAAVRDLLRLIQRQGLSPLLEDEYQKANQEWTALVARLDVVRKESERLSRPHLTKAEVKHYLKDVRAMLQDGEIHTWQALLRRFIRCITLFPNHAEVEYTFGLSALSPLGGFGEFDSPLEGAPRATRTPAPGSGGRCSIR